MGDVSSKKLMRFEQIQEKVRRQHEEEQKYKQPVNRSGGTSPTASEVSSQCMEDDNSNPYFNRHTMPPSRRITESEKDVILEGGTLKFCIYRYRIFNTIYLTIQSS